MKLRFKFLILLLLVGFIATSVDAAPFKTNAKTRRIPAGTKLKLELLNNINTTIDKEGNAFSAILIGDQKSETNVILPTGSIVRGTVREVIPSKRFSRGAVLYLDFDHIVTPTGRQMPLALAIHNRADLTFDGGLSTSKGYGEALKKNWKKTAEITTTATKYGLELGESVPGIVILTAPICAVGGTIGGGAYLIYDSIADMFRKGPDVILPKGTILDVLLSYPIDVPVS